MNQATSPEQKKYERNTSIFLAPILSVIIVAGFGFSVWIIFGPPSTYLG